MPPPIIKLNKLKNILNQKNPSICIAKTDKPPITNTKPIIDKGTVSTPFTKLKSGFSPSICYYSKEQNKSYCL